MDKTLDFEEFTGDVRRVLTLAWNLYQEGDIDDGEYNDCICVADEMIEELIGRIESMLHTALSKKKKLSPKARKIINPLSRCWSLRTRTSTI